MNHKLLRGTPLPFLPPELVLTVFSKSRQISPQIGIAGQRKGMNTELDEESLRLNWRNKTWVLQTRFKVTCKASHVCMHACININFVIR